MNDLTHDREDESAPYTHNRNGQHGAEAANSSDERTSVPAYENSASSYNAEKTRKRNSSERAPYG